MDEIEAVCMEACSEYGINFRRVKNTNEGMTERENAMALNRGLWLLERSFSRGYDLKLNVDSFVIVCDIGQKLDLTEARQMIGRGSRSQQVSNGFVLHIGPIKPLVGVSIVKILQTKEAVDIDDGGLILKAILRLWDQNNDGDRAALEVAFGAKKWKIHEQGLSGRNSNADIMSKISELLRWVSLMATKWKFKFVNEENTTLYTPFYLLSIYFISFPTSIHPKCSAL